MRFLGSVVLEKVPPLTDNVKDDYFLAFEITMLMDEPKKHLSTSDEFFHFMKEQCPKIKLSEELVNPLFTNVVLPPYLKNKPYIALGNLSDFRVGGTLANGIDQAKVNAALKLVSLPGYPALDFSLYNFELVVGTKDETLIEAINEKKLFDIKTPNFSPFSFEPSVTTVTVAESVGDNRDAVLNLPIDDFNHSSFKEWSKEVFGEDFQLRDSSGKPTAYHLPIAETNQLTKKLSLALQSIESEKDFEERPRFGMKM